MNGPPPDTKETNPVKKPLRLRFLEILNDSDMDIQLKPLRFKARGLIGILFAFVSLVIIVSMSAAFLTP